MTQTLREQIEHQIARNEETLKGAQTIHQMKYFVQRNKELQELLAHTCEICGCACIPSPNYPLSLCLDDQKEFDRHAAEAENDEWGINH